MIGSHGLGRFGWLLWVLVAAYAIRLILFTGIQGTDDVTYPARAYSLLQHGFDPAGDLFFARIGYVASLALVFSIFGIQPASLAILSLIASTLMMILAWKLGRELHSDKVGILAAAIVAFLPLDIFYATNGHLDLLQAAVGSLGIYLVWRSGKMPTAAGALRYGLLAGGVFGVAYLIKESAFFFLIPPLWLSRRREYRAAVVAAIAVYGATVGAEMIAYALFRGDAMTRFHLIQAEIEAVPAAGNGVWDRAADFAAAALSPEGSLFKFIGVLLWMAPAGILLVLLRDRERWGWIVVWLLGVVLAIGFWPRTIRPFYPALGLYDRFFTGLIVPGALLAARFLFHLSQRWGARIGAVAFASIACFNLLCAMINYQDAARWRSGPEWASKVLADHPNAVVVTDGRTLMMLQFLAKYEPSYELRPFNRSTDAPPANTLLLDNERMVAVEREWGDGVPPPWWSADSPRREVIAERSIPPRFSLRGRYPPMMRIVLSRVLP